MLSDNLIIPDWSAPSTVKAFTTTRAGGVSTGDFASFNLGLHVGDEQTQVLHNRELLQQYVGADKQLCWLEQTHSDIIVSASDYRCVVEADACVSECVDKACVVMTADCLPVLLCNQAGTKIAALHCGWKGLFHNLIGTTIRQYYSGESVIAWLGPAIGGQSYEVDDKLYNTFLQRDADYASAFVEKGRGHYLFDLYDLARRQLQNSGVEAECVYGGDFDTLTDTRFYSYRQNPRTGRMASVIYTNPKK